MARSSGLVASSHPVNLRFRADDAGFVAHVEQASDGFAAVGSVVEGAFVHVHADECIGGLRVEIAGELHGISQRFFAVIEAILNALAESSGNDGHELRPHCSEDTTAT